MTDALQAVERIRKALEAGPAAISTELYGDRYFRGSYSMAELDKQQDDFITACNPDAIRTLLTAHDSATAALRAKEEECERLRADAERYRWLREQDWFSGELCVLRDPKRILTNGTALGADCPSRDRLDTAIDTARAVIGATDARKDK